MKNPLDLASRHARLHARSSAAWALEFVLQLHGQRTGERYPFQQKRPFPEDDFAPAFLARLRQFGIVAEIQAYGADFARFEADLERTRNHGAHGCPLVRMPVVAQVDHRTAGLHVRSGTYIVDLERGEPVFLTRQPRSTAVAKIGLKQMRLLHESWRTWPVLLPSMLLTVLWHRRTGG